MLRNTLAVAAATVFVSMGITDKASAQSAVITYTASGTFASTPTSGADTLKLAGEPFIVSISVSSSTKPDKHGSNWASYNRLKLTGVVHSGLLGAEPVNIASGEASITQTIDPGVEDQFVMQAPVKVVGISLQIKAVIEMPYGTIPHFLLAPFAAPVTMTPSNATLTYSDSTAATVLAIQSGTLTGTLPKESAMVHSGSTHARAVFAPVDVALSSNRLRFAESL
jgi:hypothetical protein